MWHLSCFCHLFEVWACPILNIPAEMSVDLKQHIVDWYLVDQYTYRQIAELASCSIGHVSNVMRNFREFAQVKNPFSSHTGHPSQIEEGEVYLNALLAANPALYLDELQTSLLSVHNINLSIATISWILAQYELTRKQLPKVATEQDEELRGIWEADMPQYQDADVIGHWQWCHGWQAERVCTDAIFKRASCREGQWVLHLMKHEHTCGKMIVDRDNTISNLLRVRLGVWDWTLTTGEEVFGVSDLRCKCGENNRFVEEQAWVLIVVSPVIWSVWHYGEWWWKRLTCGPPYIHQSLPEVGLPWQLLISCDCHLI